MKNKTVIRKPNKAGEFTTIHNSILFDKRLSGNEFRIITAILSDSDNWNLYQVKLQQKLDLDKKTIKKALENLEVYGYIRKKKSTKGRENYFIISEYGNLNNKGNENVEIAEISEVTATTLQNFNVKQVSVESDKKLNLEDYKELILAVIPNDTPTQIIMNFYSDIQSRIDVGTISKPEQLSKANLEKIIAKYVSVDVSLDSFVRNLCENHAGGKGITIAQQKEITSKTLNFFKNFDGTISEKLVKNKIWTFKSKYISSGHLDQKYQN